MSNDLLEDSMMPFSEVKGLIESYRQDLWSRWFRFQPQGPIKVQLRDPKSGIDGSDGFDPGTHITYIYYDEWDLERDSFDQFPTDKSKTDHEQSTNTYPLTGWQKVVIEELCHEFQNDVIGNKADDYGRFLHAHYGPLNTPHGRHPDSFTSAIAKFSLTFGYDVHKLIRSMWTHLKEVAPPNPDHLATFAAGHQLRREQLELPARVRWENSDRQEGHDLEDWFLTEQQEKALVNVKVP